ncbi:MAG TPA: hypothetical protein VNO81_14925, partial [Candidatus Nitrosotenuis sp.]|nr:hypothetical protein [Candidatus Nitrosotenuis sp.]
FRLVAGRTIQVQGSMNGRALSALPRDQHPIQVGEGSIGEILEGIADLEAYQAYVEEMMGQLERVMGELEKKGEDPGFLALGIAIFAAQQVQSIGGWTGLPVSTGGFGFDPGEKALTWNGSMYVPDKMPMLIPCNLVIRGHLLVGPGALVLVNGRLKIEGRLILKKDSLVLVKKDLEVQDRVNVAYAAGQEMAIRSFLMAEGDIHLGRGVRHLKKDYSGGSVKFPFAGNANPFEKMIKQKKGKDWIWVVNPAWVTFNQIQSQLLGQLLSACNPLQRFLMATLAIPLGDEDSQTPGLLIASEKGGVYIHDHEPGAVAAGMILTREGIVLEFPPDGSGIFTGVLMTSSGDIQAFTTQLRYYPYYAVAPVLEAGQLCVPVAYPLASGVADTPGRRP